MNEILLLKRVSTTPRGTFGVLLFNGIPVATTLEPPWLNNQRNKSSIPAGVYSLTKHESPKFGRTFLVNDVPGRSGILIHAGNRLMDTEGCILVGSGFHGDYINNSRQALEELLLLVKYQIILQIKDPQ